MNHGVSMPPQKLHFLCSGVYFAEGGKQFRNGEDARLIKDDCIGVFDGVGGLYEKGINCGKYARQLSREIIKNLERDQKESIYSNIRRGLSANDLKGSCTVCCAKLEGNNLFIAHIGDSGLLKVSSAIESKVDFTDPQQHFHSCPKQVSYNTRKNDKLRLTNKPSHRLKWEVQDGDVLVMGSDGLWDNLSRSEVARIVKKHMPRCRKDEERVYESVTHKYVLERALMQSSDGYLPRNKGELSMIIAKEVAMKACKASKSVGTPTPFSKEKLEHLKQKHKMYDEKGYQHRGKPDDITVIVAIPTVTDEKYSHFVRLSVAECNEMKS